MTTAGECPTTNVRSDEFNGSALDTSKWTVIRPDDTHPFEVANGSLRLPIDNGSIYGDGHQRAEPDRPAAARRATSR